MFEQRDYEQVAKSTLKSRPVLHKIRRGKVRCGRKIRSKFLKGPVTCKTCQRLILWDRENSFKNKKWKKLFLKSEYCSKKHQDDADLQIVIEDDIEVKACLRCLGKT